MLLLDQKNIYNTAFSYRSYEYDISIPKDLQLSNMNFWSIVEVFLPVAVLLIATQIAKINGRNSERFGTAQCNHNQLATAIATGSTCVIENSLKYVQNMLKNYKDETNGGKTFNLKTACEITNAIAITEGKECPVNFAKSCLPNYVAPALEAMYDRLILNCSCSLT